MGEERWQGFTDTVFSLQPRGRDDPTCLLFDQECITTKGDYRDPVDNRSFPFTSGLVQDRTRELYSGQRLFRRCGDRFLATSGKGS